MTVFVGTSGWQYPHWRGRFYPREVKHAEWLEYYAARFRAVEVNNTFYRLPETGTFTKWARHTPTDFIMALKASRFLTHIRRLHDPREPVKRFLEHAARLGTKLGPVLLQLPPNLKVEPRSLDETLACFPSGVRVAVEFRHESWFTKEIQEVLAGHRAALCLVDRGSRVLGPVTRTANWTYVRLHEGRARPHPCYGRKALDGWAARLSDVWKPDEDIYVFFNNDARGCAVRDAAAFAPSVERAGLVAARAPDPATIRAE